MTAIVDTAVWNEWIACGWVGQIATGASNETTVLGQKIRITCIDESNYEIVTLPDDQSAGRRLPAEARFCCIFTSLGEPTSDLPLIPEFEESDRKIGCCGGIGIRTSPYRIIENFIDMAHFSFVHTDLLGLSDKTEVLAYRTEHRADVDEIWAIDCMYVQPLRSKAVNDVEGGKSESHMTTRDYRIMSPFSVMLYRNTDSDPTRNHAICVFVQPVSETECLAYMTFAYLVAGSSVSDLVDFQQAIFLQDRVILENQRPALLPLDPTYELPTKADASSIAFRRWLKRKNIRYGTFETQAG